MTSESKDKSDNPRAADAESNSADTEGPVQRAGSDVHAKSAESGSAGPISEDTTDPGAAGERGGRADGDQISKAREQGYQPLPYVAEYSIKARGFSAGLLTMVLSEQDDIWLQQNIAIPSGMARMFSDTILEDSHFILNPKHGVEPISYHLREEDNGKYVKAEYTNAGRQMRVEYKNAKKMDDGTVEQAPPSDEVFFLDDTNWIVQTAFDYLNDKLPRDYEILGLSGPHAYKLAYSRDEDVQIGDNEYKCVVIRRIRTSRKNDYIEIWLSKQHNYTPVRIERHKNDTMLFQMMLSILAFN